jgi:endonuclease/exonuclease/phosphatase family metal-dependent hydrolase
VELSTDCVPDLSVVPKGERDRLAREAASGGAYAPAPGRVPALRQIEVAAGSASPPTGACRIVAWNAERCRTPRAAAAMLAPLGAAAWLLTELDVGMARSGQAHTARRLAEHWGAGFAFAVEFLELGLGGATEQREHAGKQNEIGYHGAAILSPHELGRPALVRLDEGGDWWDGQRGEMRVGGRIALLATLEVAGTPITLASVHLENHAGPERRDAQTAALLEAIDVYAPARPVLIGGDFNTHGLSLAALEDREQLARELRDDPSRLRSPIAHEPLFDRLQRSGFDVAESNCVTTSTQRTPDGRGSLHLDWFFARGLETSAPEVVAALDPETGETLSDHEALVVTIAPSTR